MFATANQNASVASKIKNAGASLPNANEVSKIKNAGASLPNANAVSKIKNAGASLPERERSEPKSKMQAQACRMRTQ